MMGNGNYLETFSTQAYQQNSQYIKIGYEEIGLYYLKKLKGKFIA